MVNKTEYEKYGDVFGNVRDLLDSDDVAFESDKMILSATNRFINHFLVGVDLASVHKTVQQMLMNTFLGFLAGEELNYRLGLFDARNQATVKLAHEIYECLKNSNNKLARVTADNIDNNIEEMRRIKYPHSPLPMV